MRTLGDERQLLCFIRPTALSNIRHTKRNNGKGKLAHLSNLRWWRTFWAGVGGDRPELPATAAAAAVAAAAAAAPAALATPPPFVGGIGMPVGTDAAFSSAFTSATKK